MKLLLIDGNNLIHKSYHVNKNLRTSSGIHSGALYGFILMLVNIKDRVDPTNAVIVFDHSRKNFRNKIYPEYKLNRKETDSDLVHQFKLCKKASIGLGISILEKKGYEADDLIATICSKYSDKIHIIIVSSDKDLMQLLNPSKIDIWDLTTKRFLSNEDILNKFGVYYPRQILDILALTGDKVDNIPGVTNIGKVTASKLINEYGSVDKLLSNIEKVKNYRIKNLILSQKDNLNMSYKLVKLNTSVKDIPTLKELSINKIDKTMLRTLCEEYELFSIIKRLKLYEEDTDKRFKINLFT